MLQLFHYCFLCLGRLFFSHIWQTRLKCLTILTLLTYFTNLRPSTATEWLPALARGSCFVALRDDGTNAGDHPPITPTVKLGTQKGCG